MNKFWQLFKHCIITNLDILVVLIYLENTEVVIEEINQVQAIQLYTTNIK